MSRFRWELLLNASLAASLLSGCPLFRLKNDLAAIRGSAMISGVISAGASTGPIYVVQVQGNTPSQIQKLSPSGGFFCFLVEPEKRMRVIAFADENANASFDATEPWGEVGDTLILGPREQRSVSPIALASHDPRSIVGLLHGAALPLGPQLPVARGEITKLTDPRFSEESAKRGMWEPLLSARTTGFGIYFLQAHAPGKTPVVFVHGMQGSPLNFEPIIARLAPDEEAWLVHYPSGIRLPVAARILADSLVALRRQHRIERMRLVAHSMGGLVSRAAMLELRERGETDGIEEFVTIATPFGGIPSAQSGLDSPFSSVPSWTDLAPESDFLKGLRRPLPKSMRFRLIAAVGSRSGILGGNNDGTVPVASQLPEWVMEGASRVLSFDVGHVDVLAHASVLAEVTSHTPNP